MPVPARDLWTRIQREIRDKPGRQELRIARGCLNSWHDSWKGPHWDLKERLRGPARKREDSQSERALAPQRDLGRVGVLERRDGEAPSEPHHLVEAEDRACVAS